MAVAATSTAAAVEAPAKTKRPQIRNVLLNLENCILSDERLTNTPSMQDGLDPEIETDLRFIGCEMIQSAGILLRLPQVAMATGQVLYQRFYYSKSFVGHNFEIVAMACIVLASKIEEAPRRVRDVLNVFHRMEQIRKEQPLEPLLLDSQYLNMKNLVIKAERRVLKELGFCVHVKHPHKMIVTLLEVVLRSESNDRLVQIAWNYMNDSLRSDVFVRHTPETIACACIHLAARIMQIPLPTEPAWYEALRIDESELQAVALRILSLYARPKVDVERVDSIVKDLRAKQEEEKKRRLALATGNRIDAEARENNADNALKRVAVPIIVNTDDLPTIDTSNNGLTKKPPAEIKPEIVKSSPPTVEVKKYYHRSRDVRDRDKPRDYRSRRSPSSDDDRSSRKRIHKRRRDHSRSISPDRRRRNRGRFQQRP